MDFNGDDFKGQDTENPYDSNFDAGVNADEEEDPRTYIQQLTGKLSQSLRAYNEDRPQPDTDLCKYVAGMINKQASEGLSDKDVKEILDKIEAGEDFELEGDNDDKDERDISHDDGKNNYDMKDDNEPHHHDDMNDDEEIDSIKKGGGNVKTESITKRELLDEIFNDIINNKNNEQSLGKPVRDISFRKKPFTSPSFK